MHLLVPSQLTLEHPNFTSDNKTMASKPKTLAILLFALSTLSLIINTSFASDEPGIAVYWGQNGNEGSLRQACASKNYQIVILGFLSKFGSGRTPELNFASHCNNYWNPCTKLAPEIQYCQRKNIKVFLSLGGSVGSYSLSSPEDAEDVAQYLFNNFLSGQRGPLGSVSLDGIDFDIESGSNDYYDDLAKALNSYSEEQDRKFSLSVAPGCMYPDYYLDSAIKTGLFDYISVQFYNNPPCEYSNGNVNNLLNHWDTWTTAFPNSSVLLGLPASRNAVSSGFIPAVVVKDQILPYMRHAPNYGGVMLWDRYHDVQTNFSVKIKGSIKSALKAMGGLGDAVYESVTRTLNRYYHGVPKISAT